MVLSNPIFSSTGRVNSKVPYSGCKAEEEGEWAQPHQQPAFPTRKELKMKEESVCTIYGVEWLSLISSSLSLPFLPSARLATLGPRLDLFENNQGGVHSIKSFMPNYSFWKGQGTDNPFHWFLKAINPRFPHIYSPSRIGSASDDEPMRKLSLLLAPGY